MVLNDRGMIVMDSWTWLETQYDYVELGEYVIMPNHMHGLLLIKNIDRGGAACADNAVCKGGSRTAPTSVATDAKRKSIGRLIGAFKTVSTKRINDIDRGDAECAGGSVPEGGSRTAPTPTSMPRAKLWQRNYWEHIVRNESELIRIRDYILYNPGQWESDRLHGTGSSAANGVRESRMSYEEESWMV
jgi:REP element-mobilizing transposase RayT